MSDLKRKIKYGSSFFEYDLLTASRKTLEISVYPDCSIVVKAPQDSENEVIESKILKRMKWIIKQINYFRQFQPKTPEPRYIAGETHHYLGNQYRLKINKSSIESVKLTNGYFHINYKQEKSTEIIKSLLENWYNVKAAKHFDESLNRCWNLFKDDNLIKPTISIRKMKNRWGSHTSDGKINLNLNLIRAPKDCIDYVMIHELCHLVYNNHSQKFYNLLESKIPNWQKIKHKLELVGDR